MAIPMMIFVNTLTTIAIGNVPQNLQIPCHSNLNVQKIVNDETKTAIKIEIGKTASITPNSLVAESMTIDREDVSI